MSVLNSVLLEEIERLERNISEYQKILSSLPRGSIFIRKIGGSSYAYRKRKENGKIVSEYLGNIDSDEAKRQIELSEEYKRIKSNIKIGNEELMKIRKAYHFYARKRN